MEENMDFTKPSAGQSALYYGLLLGVALIVVHLILYLLDLQRETAASIVTIAVTIAGMALAAMDYRNKKWKGFISYGKAVKIAFLTILFASIIFAAYTFVYHSFINPADIQETKLKAIQDVYNMGMEPAQEEQALKWQDYIHTPQVYFFITIFFNLFIGIILALLIAIFIKKEEKPSIS
jgi:prepilin signal peptidase PulO-like enzyme (type II secretory pathway)